MRYKIPLILTVLVSTLSGCSYSYHKTSSEEEIAKPANPMQITVDEDTVESAQIKKAPRKIIIYRIH
ncbi:hypothetical protein [Marinomonas algicola]|uniref:hypothetical protein n=1 Tax=Marinomonas algicola TaxID=2773454 RepID=UPI00174DA927|nr:hypothetical protein [Marinomonas algicola]